MQLSVRKLVGSLDDTLSQIKLRGQGASSQTGAPADTSAQRMGGAASVAGAKY